MAKRVRVARACEALVRTRDVEHTGVKVMHELKNSLTAVKALVQLGLRNSETASGERDRKSVV